MRYQYDENGEISKVSWVTYQDAIRKRANKPENQDKIGQKMWINTQEYIDAMVKKHYNDAKTIAKTIRTTFLTDADKESLALEGLYEAAGLYDPTKGMKLTSFIYRRIRQVLLREMKFAQMSLRCAQVPLEEALRDHDDPEENDDSVPSPKKRSVQEIPESATGYYQEDGTKRTIFETYFRQQADPGFDYTEFLQHLTRRLNERQRFVFDRLMTQDVTEADIARELGVTRQAVNLYLIAIRKKATSVLKLLAPDVKTED